MGGHWCQNCPARGPGVSWPGDGWLWVRVRGAHGWRGQGWLQGLVAAVSKRFAPQHLQFLLWKLPKAPLGAEACHSLHVVAGAVPFLQMPGERWQCPKDTGGRTAALHQGSERPDGILCLETFTPHPLQQRTPQHPSIPWIITGSSPGAAGDSPTSRRQPGGSRFVGFLHELLRASPPAPFLHPVPATLRPCEMLHETLRSPLGCSALGLAPEPVEVPGNRSRMAPSE